MGIPVKLKEIAEYLSDNPVVLSSRSKDGRTNAVTNEREVLRALPREFDISASGGRNWHDFTMTVGGVFCPVNVKVTEVMKGHADNLNCKLGIYYALTGQVPDFSNEIGWGKFFTKLKANLGVRQNRDYFFLVVDKGAQGAFVNSLRGLSAISPAGNNPPFQCVWRDNLNFQKRSFDEAVAFIMKPLGQTAFQRARMYADFKEVFPEYV